MKRDKEIRNLIKAVSPEPGDKERFMKEFARQIDLLPEPASMRTPEDLDKAECLQQLSDLMARTKIRRGLESAAVYAFAVAAGLFAGAAAYFLTDPAVYSAAVMPEKLAGFADSLSSTFPAWRVILSCVASSAVILSGIRLLLPEED